MPVGFVTPPPAKLRPPPPFGPDICLSHDVATNWKYDVLWSRSNPPSHHLGPLQVSAYFEGIQCPPDRVLFRIGINTALMQPACVDFMDLVLHDIGMTTGESAKDWFINPEQSPLLSHFPEFQWYRDICCSWLFTIALPGALRFVMV